MRSEAGYLEKQIEICVAEHAQLTEQVPFPAAAEYRPASNVCAAVQSVQTVAGEGGGGAEGSRYREEERAGRAGCFAGANQCASRANRVVR